MPYIEPERRKAMKKPMGDLMQQVGVLVCTALEFYRRMVSPYEDTKIKEHGDVE
jgi:hypothetical protein